MQEELREPHNPQTAGFAPILPQREQILLQTRPGHEGEKLSYFRQVIPKGTQLWGCFTWGHPKSGCSWGVWMELLCHSELFTDFNAQFLGLK